MDGAQIQVPSTELNTYAEVRQGDQVELGGRVFTVSTRLHTSDNTFVVLVS